MSIGKRDLLIHYDEERGELVFHSVPVESTGDLRANSFDGVRPEVAFYRELPPDEAEQALGRLVFSLIDLNSQNKIGVRDYKAEADAGHVEYVKELEEQAKGNDSGAQYHLALEMHRSAMNNYSLHDLARAKSLLMAAVNLGHENAKETLESWPLLKAAAERRIARGKPV
jgi:hypothetical protein